MDGADTTGGDAVSRAEIERVLTELIEAWNRHDMTAYAAVFAEDADFVNVVGMHWRGHAEIEAQHRTIHATIMRRTRLRSMERTVRFIGAEVALAHARWEMTGTEPVPGWQVPDVRRGLMTCVLVRTGRHWQIAAAHNTDIVPVQLPEV